MKGRGTLHGIGKSLDQMADDMEPPGLRAVWHALSTNMFEGWEPNESDVLRLKKKSEELREESNAAQTVWR
jgi:hypothetical protein